MKDKLKFILAILLIILAIYSLFINQKKNIITPLPENIAVENNQIQRRAGWPASEIPVPGRAITIIKKVKRDDKAKPLPVIDKEGNELSALINKEDKKDSSGNPLSETAPEYNDEMDSNELEPGITIINKRPSKEEKKEMRSKGIILY